MLVVGGLSLALAESYTAPSPAPTTSLPTVPETLTSTPAGSTAYPSATLLPTATQLPPTNCLPPAGWILIAVHPYDTLESLAARFRVSPYQLAQANCLLTDNLAPGYTIYIPPPLPPPAQIIERCGAPFGWVRAYLVQPGDTLYRIAGSFGISVYELQQANCLPNTFITPGNLLWVPNLPTVTPQRNHPSRVQHSDPHRQPYPNSNGYAEFHSVACHSNDCSNGDLYTYSLSILHTHLSDTDSHGLSNHHALMNINNFLKGQKVLVKF
jgi:LysM repeat protein